MLSPATSTGLAIALCGVSSAFALVQLRRLLDERARLAAQVRALADRVAAAERAAALAQERADSAMGVLVDKGLADEDLAAKAGGQDERGPSTVH